MVFIQFAGFTFGKSASAFATPWNGYPGNNYSFLIGGHDTVTGVNNIQYTAQFGNGVSGTIGLDDPTVFNRTSLLEPVGLGVNLPPVHRHALPTLTAACVLPTSSATSVSIRPGVSSSFGRRALVNASYNSLALAAIRTTCRKSAAIPRQVGLVGDGCVADQEHPDRCRRRHQVQRSYAEGITKYVISTTGGSPSFAMFGRQRHCGGVSERWLRLTPPMASICPGVGGTAASS